jgi:hypothetical protein
MDKNDHIYESASEALHIVQFESFVKSMTSCLSKLKVTPGFCFPNTILDFVQCKPIPVMKTGFSLGSFSRWEKPVFITGNPVFITGMGLQCTYMTYRIFKILSLDSS